MAESFSNDFANDQGKSEASSATEADGGDTAATVAGFDVAADANHDSLGCAGNDSLSLGDGENDTHFDGTSDDTVDGGKGADEGWGGDGSDTHLFMEALGNDTFHGGTAPAEPTSSSSRTRSATRRPTGGVSI